MVAHANVRYDGEDYTSLASFCGYCRAKGIMIRLVLKGVSKTRELCITCYRELTEGDENEKLAVISDAVEDITGPGLLLYETEYEEEGEEENDDGLEYEEE